MLEGDDYAEREELLKEFNDLIENNRRTGGVVIAAGISDYRQSDDASFRQVFDRADQLMYSRKKILKDTQ